MRVYQFAPKGLNHVKVVSWRGTTGASGDYATLLNKPAINSVQLNGNKTAYDLGLATPSDISSAIATKADQSDLSAEISARQTADTTINARIDNIIALEYIDELLAVNMDSAVAITSNSVYVTPHGKYVVVNGRVYFKILFYNKTNVNTGTGASVPVANLPIPNSTAVFYEVGAYPYAIGSRLTYETVWRLYGSRTKGNYSLVYGSYEPAS